MAQSLNGMNYSDKLAQIKTTGSVKSEAVGSIVLHKLH